MVTDTLFSPQLYHAPWIDAVRGTRVGALALGANFNPPDLIAYAFGIGFAAMIEHIGRRIRWPGTLTA
ncbi:MAG: DUF2809 domain-containing protein [Verrucomicrobiota bacterium]|nr:DUF2809 domain-containing protein [Verrucomicrobiota bacterium]